MSLPSFPPLQLEVGAARYQRAAVLFALVSALAGPWLTLSLSVTTHTFGSIAGLMLTCLGSRHLGWWGQRHWRRAVWHGDGRWTLTDRAGRELTAFLSSETRVTRHFVRLSWSTDCRCLLLAPRDLPAATWRRLVTRLRLQRDWTQAEAAYRFPESVAP